MTKTTYYELNKPESTDTVDVSKLNENADTLDDALYNLSGALAIVQLTDTATQNIGEGSLVLWKGALYKASAAITSGETLSVSNLTSVPAGGIFNNFQDAFLVETVEIKAGSTGTINKNVSVAKTGYKAIGVIGSVATGDYAAQKDTWRLYIDIANQNICWGMTGCQAADWGVNAFVLYVKG